jgi:precorrin-6Y C5,15-methyltransferase (decarboxylating)
MQKWLSVVGIDEDGVLGLNWVTRSLVEQAEVLVGGDRQLNILAKSDKLNWASPLIDTMDAM